MPTDSDSYVNPTRPPERPVEEVIAEAIRVGGIAWRREHDPEWRDKPWHDGISVDVDEADVLATLTQSVLDALEDYIRPLALAALNNARWIPEGPLVRGCVHDTSEHRREVTLAAVAPWKGKIK
jgi:hypothetical protein